MCSYYYGIQRGDIVRLHVSLPLHSCSDLLVSSHAVAFSRADLLVTVFLLDTRLAHGEPGGFVRGMWGAACGHEQFAG